MNVALVLGAWLLAAAVAQAQSAPGIRVVTETTPYTYQSGERVVGPATEVVEKTLQAAGLTDYQIRLYPWARAYDLALKEPDVLIFLIARTPAREPLFHWTAEIMKIQYHLYRLRDRTDVQVRSLDDAKSYVVGVIRDDVRHQYLQSKGFARLVLSAQWADNFNKLLTRQVDLVPLTEDDAATRCQQTHFDCKGLQRLLTLDEASTGLYMAYSRATAAAVVDRTRAAFDRLKADGTVRRLMEQRP